MSTDRPPSTATDDGGPSTGPVDRSETAMT